MELEHYGRPTCNKTMFVHPRRVDRRSCYRPSTSFVHNTIDLLFEFETKFETNLLIFGGTRIVL